jgi:hypothetical protein
MGTEEEYAHEHVTVTTLSWQRFVSVGLATAYVVSAFIRSGPLATVQMTMYSVLPVACIWFPEVLAEFLGGITHASPPGFVSVLGWVVLLVPLLERGIWYFEGARSWLF